ncbi:unnamed protein product, partial [Bubo scandiacus]
GCHLGGHCHQQKALMLQEKDGCPVFEERGEAEALCLSSQIWWWASHCSSMHTYFYQSRLGRKQRVKHLLHMENGQYHICSGVLPAEQPGTEPEKPFQSPKTVQLRQQFWRHQKSQSGVNVTENLCVVTCHSPMEGTGVL